MNKASDKALTSIPEITAGWLHNARVVKSTHFNSRPKAEISLLVIHNISLPPAEFGTDNVERFFTGNLAKDAHPYFETIYTLEVSSHFFIKRTGEIIQFVSCLDRAWHAGISCFYGRTACNDFAIGIELEGTDTIPYTKSQYQTLHFLTLALMENYPEITINRIVGHNHIAPNRKTDPGESFRWTDFLSWLKDSLR